MIFSFLRRGAVQGVGLDVDRGTQDTARNAGVAQVEAGSRRGMEREHGAGLLSYISLVRLCMCVFVGVHVCVYVCVTVSVSPMGIFGGITYLVRV
jgi:hypothetical protein